MVVEDATNTREQGTLCTLLMDLLPTMMLDLVAFRELSTTFDLPAKSTSAGDMKSEITPSFQAPFEKRPDCLQGWQYESWSAGSGACLRARRIRRKPDGRDRHLGVIVEAERRCDVNRLGTKQPISTELSIQQFFIWRGQATNNFRAMG